MSASHAERVLTGPLRLEDLSPEVRREVLDNHREININDQEGLWHSQTDKYREELEGVGLHSALFDLDWEPWDSKFSVRVKSVLPALSRFTVPESVLAAQTQWVIETGLPLPRKRTHTFHAARWARRPNIAATGWLDFEYGWYDVKEWAGKEQLLDAYYDWRSDITSQMVDEITEMESSFSERANKLYQGLTSDEAVADTLTWGYRFDEWGGSLKLED